MDLCIPASKVHELLNKIHDILNNEVSKWVGNTHHILAYLFISACRQYSESGFHTSPFLTVLRSLFVLVRLSFIAVLIGLWLLLSNNQQPVVDSSSRSLAKKNLTWRLGLRVFRVARSPLEVHLLVLQTLGRKSHGGCIPDVLQFLSLSPSSSFAVQVGTFPKFLD